MAALAAAILKRHDNRRALDLAFDIDVLLEDRVLHVLRAIGHSLLGRLQFGLEGGKILPQQVNVGGEGAGLVLGQLAQLVQLTEINLNILQHLQLAVLQVGNAVLQQFDLIFEGGVFLVLFDLHLLGLVADDVLLRLGHFALEIEPAHFELLQSLLLDGQRFLQLLNASLFAFNLPGDILKLTPD